MLLYNRGNWEDIMVKTRVNWSFNETKVALYILLNVDDRYHSKLNPLIKEIADDLGRTPSSIVMKIENLRYLITDGSSGLPNGSKMDKEVTDDYFNNQEHFFSDYGELIDFASSDNRYNARDLDKNGTLGKDILREVKVRVNQHRFREKILKKFNSRCLLSGVSQKELLIASHIIPWSKSAEHEKLDVNNGICLSYIYDHLFDKGYISFNENYEIIVSSKLNDDNNTITQNLIDSIVNKKFDFPNKSIELQNNLLYHHTNLFIK